MNKSLNIKDSSRAITIKNLRPNLEKKQGGSGEMMNENKEKESINLYEEKIKRKNERAVIFKKLQE